MRSLLWAFPFTMCASMLSPAAYAQGSFMFSGSVPVGTKPAGSTVTKEAPAKPAPTRQPAEPSGTRSLGPAPAAPAAAPQKAPAVTPKSESQTQTQTQPAPSNQAAAKPADKPYDGTWQKLIDLYKPKPATTTVSPPAPAPAAEVAASPKAEAPVKTEKDKADKDKVKAEKASADNKAKVEQAKAEQAKAEQAKKEDADKKALADKKAKAEAAAKLASATTTVPDGCSSKFSEAAKLFKAVHGNDVDLATLGQFPGFFKGQKGMNRFKDSGGSLLLNLSLSMLATDVPVTICKKGKKLTAKMVTAKANKVDSREAHPMIGLAINLGQAPEAITLNITREGKNLTFEGETDGTRVDATAALR